jgi:small subunit ribosomal protein S2
MFVRGLSENGENILFVGTKKQAQESIRDEATRAGAFYVNSRWPGGMLTNFRTIRHRIEQPRSAPQDGGGRHLRPAAQERSRETPQGNR